MTDNFMMSDEVMGHDQIDLSLEMETMEKRKRKGKQEVSYEMEVSQDEGGSQQGPSNCRGWAKKKQRVIRESCLVCLENYAQTRQKVSCEKCEYHACQGCVQRYLEEKQAEPHCMNCKEEFSMLFAYSNLQKPWLTTSMKEIRCNNLFQPPTFYIILALSGEKACLILRAQPSIPFLEISKYKRLVPSKR